MPLHSNKIPKHIRESLIIPDKAHFYHKMIKCHIYNVRHYNFDRYINYDRVRRSPIFCGRVKGTSGVSDQFAEDLVGGEEAGFGDADAGALPLKSSFAQKGVNNSAVCQ